MNDFVIHIGPPKTATTSFQCFLQQTNMKWFVYGGVVQPRNIMESSICSLAYHDIVSRKKKNRDHLLVMIERYLKENKNILLSEECFLFEDANMTWKEKIESLHEYFHDYSPTILLTIRNPKHALISYYIELYNALPKTFKKEFRLFLESDYCSIYKYNKLLLYLKSLNFKVIIFEFEKLVNGAYYFSDLFPTICKDNQSFLLEKNNVTLVREQKYFAKPRTTRSIVKRRIIDKFFNINILKIFRRGRGISDKLALMIPDFKLSQKEIKCNFNDYDYSNFTEEYHSIKDRIY